MSSFIFGEWEIGGKPGTEPDGFRGIKWGTHISSLSGMRYYRTDPSYGGVHIYIRVGDKLQIGGAKLDRIEYGFWQERFCGVTIYTSGSVNWYSLKDAVFETFGRGYQPNEFIEKYFWGGTETGMILEYNEITEKGSLWMSSRKISKEMEEWDKRKAKEGAKDF